MKRTRLISTILVILMLLNALSPCLNVVFAETINSTQVDAGNITLGSNDGTVEGTNNSGIATYVSYGEFNNKLYKAIKADLNNQKIDFKYDNNSRTISINSNDEAKITALNLNYGGIKDIKDLSKFKNVTELYLSHNDLSEDSNLEELNSMNLSKLDISSNRISDVSKIETLINTLKEHDGIVMGNQVCESVKALEFNIQEGSDSPLTAKFDLPQILTLASNVKPHWERIEFMSESNMNPRYYVLEGDKINDASLTNVITVKDMPIYVTQNYNQITLNIGTYPYDPSINDYRYVFKSGMIHFRLKIVDDATEAAQANNTNPAANNLLHDSVFDLYFIIHDETKDAISLKDSNLYKAIKDQLIGNQEENPKLSSYKYLTDASGNDVVDSYIGQKVFDELTHRDETKFFILTEKNGNHEKKYYYDETAKVLYQYHDLVFNSDADKTKDAIERQILSFEPVNLKVEKNKVDYNTPEGPVVSYVEFEVARDDGEDASSKTLYCAAYDDAKTFVIYDTVILNEIDNLKLNNKQIRDLRGIDGFFGLALELNLSHNYLESIEPLTKIMESKAAREASLKAEYTKWLSGNQYGNLSKSYGDAKSALDEINAISEEIKKDQDTLKNALVTYGSTVVSANSTTNPSDNLQKTIDTVRKKWDDKPKEGEDGAFESYGYFTRLYGRHDDKNDYEGAYEKLLKALSGMNGYMDDIFGVYDKNYKMTTLLADSLNYQNIQEYEEYLKKTDTFEDEEATFESASSVLQEQIAYIKGLESSKSLTDFEKRLLGEAFGINYYKQTETPIGDTLDEMMENISNRFSALNMINKFRKVAVYAEMANYCTLYRMSSPNKAGDDCFVEDYLKNTINEKEKNQIDASYEKMILSVMNSDSQSGLESELDRKLFNAYIDYKEKLYSYSIYEINGNNLNSMINQDGVRIAGNRLSLATMKPGETMTLDRIAVIEKNVVLLNADPSGYGKFKYELDRTGISSDDTKITNNVLTIAPDETATSINIKIFNPGSQTEITSFTIAIDSNTTEPAQYSINCSGKYKDLYGIGIDVLDTKYSRSDIENAIPEADPGKSNYKQEALAFYDSTLKDIMFNGLDYKDVVLSDYTVSNNTITRATLGINETPQDAYSTKINSKNNQVTINNLMALAQRLINGNIDRYVQIPKLVDLDISYNAELSDIAGVTKINTLTKLNAEYDYVANVDQVDWSQLPDIRELNLGFNFITDMTPLTKLKHLKSLNLRNNFLTEVPISPDDYKSLFRYLKELDLSGNRISDLSPLIVYLEHITNGDYANYLAENQDGIILKFENQTIELDAGDIYLSEHPEVFDFELPKIFTQLQAIDVKRTSYGIRSEYGRMETEGTYATLPTRTVGEKEGKVLIQPMPNYDTCVGNGTTAIIKYNVLAERVATATLSPSGQVAVEKGSTKKFSVSVDNIDPSIVNITWEIIGNKSPNTKIVDGELTVAEDETATSITVYATATGGTLGKRLMAEVLVAEPGSLTPDPEPENPTEKTVKMTPANTSQIAKDSNKEYTVDCTGFSGEGISDMSVEWTLTGKTSENTKISEPTGKELSNGAWGSKTTVTVAEDETAETLTLTAKVNWKEGSESKSETVTNTITVVAKGQEVPDEPESKIVSVTLNPHGTIDLEKGKSTVFNVTMERLEGYDNTKGVNVVMTGDVGDGKVDTNTKLEAVNNSSFRLTVSPAETNNKITIKVSSVEDPTKYDTVVINVKNPGENPEHPTANITLGYKVVDETNLTNILPKTPINDFESKLVNNSDDYVVVVKKNGSVVSSGNIPTGSTVEIQDKEGRTLKDTNGKLYVYDVVVKGDINGDGTADSLDSLLIKAHRMEVSRLVGTEALAADIDGDGDIDLDDARLLLYHRAEVKGYVFNYK
ncbi:MAG: hypothetical protein K6D97_08495 [Clostridia bacterium]|nr:hypothetical protein [Clostridia bacterium]